MSARPPAGSDPADVSAGFDAAAEHYDLLVRLNPGYHKHLRMSACRLHLQASPRPRLLDLGCGTGASTAALLRVHPRAEVVGVDASGGMVAAARAKPWPPGVRFVHARAEDLSTALHREGIEPGFDGVLAAYLVRNVADRDGVLAAVRDLLAPGGRLVVHEYSVADSGWARARWRVVCHGVVVPLAWAVSRDTTLYRYLERSVLAFDGVGAFENRLRRAGFTGVRALPATGWQRGIVHSFVATAPGSGTQAGPAA
ncbi:MAG TPA: class I SAM-dependent methyltransferase [Nocardioidaceae bacterium]|nr:class I SAM-dependent methyltransferase [Nocardioidaceae bacterium]